MRKVSKGFIKKILASFGYELRRISLNKESINIKRLLDDPREAFIPPNHHYTYSFKAPPSLVIDQQAFGFGSWHPFTHALKTTKSNPEKLNAELRRFYDRFKPENAHQSIAGFSKSPDIFKKLPPFMFHLTPWSSGTPESISLIVKGWVEADNAEHGEALSLIDHGYPSFGPVSERKLDIQTRRLSELYTSILSHGFDRSKGECGFLVLRLGTDIRLIPGGGGYHRTAVAAALNIPYVPGSFHPGRLILDIDDVDLWSNVRSGLWTREQATKYVEHLFSFDASAWARDRDLLDCTRTQ